MQGAAGKGRNFNYALLSRTEVGRVRRPNVR